MIPVHSFPDTSLAVVQGLKARFAEFGEEFSGTRVATAKDDNNTHPYEVIVVATGGHESNSGTIKRVPISLLVFAPDYGKANRLAAKTSEFMKSLPALRGPINWIEITNDGEHIENPGTQQLRNIIAQATIRASKTTIY